MFCLAIGAQEEGKKDEKKGGGGKPGRVLIWCFEPRAMSKSGLQVAKMEAKLAELRLTAYSEPSNLQKDVRQLRHCFGPFPTQFLAITPYTRRVL